MSDLVTIAAYLTSWEAHILRGRLEVENIYAVVVDDIANSFNVFATSTGARVQVRSEDAARALEIKREGIQASNSPAP